MDLSKIFEKRHEAAKYSVKEIEHIIKTFGKRDPGSEGERKACEYMAKVLRDDCGCDRVTIESFKLHPKSFYGWLYFTITLALLAILAMIWAPIFSIIFVIAGLVIGFLQFGLYKKFIDGFFPEKTGTNVTAIKHPTGEVKRRILFCGHPDATWEWPVNYHFGGIAFDIHILSALLGAIYYMILAIISVAQGRVFGTLDFSTPIGKAYLVGLIFVPLLIGLYKMVDFNLVVDGANDNLSGCYIGIVLLKMLQDEGIEFENTEIGVLLTGCEEAGLRGAKAWAEAHKEEFSDVETIIYAFDTIRESKYLMANYRNLNATVKSDAEVADLFMEGAKAAGVPCSKGMVPPFGGATDDAAFTQAGFRAAGITGLNHKIERYYHTRLDSYDNMHEGAIADCLAATIKTLELYDNKNNE
jgi:hypothetical protein